MDALALKVLIKPIEITVGGRSVVAPEVKQIIAVRAEENKFVRLLEMLGELYDRDEDARTLIFVDRKEAADTLVRELMRRGYPCMCIHGAKEQMERDSCSPFYRFPRENRSRKREGRRLRIWWQGARTP